MSKCPDLRDGRCRCVRLTYRIGGWLLVAWLLAIVAAFAIAAQYRPVHIAVTVVLALFSLPLTPTFWAWFYTRQLQRERLAKVHAYSLERDIDALERELGVGVGEDWWKP